MFETMHNIHQWIVNAKMIRESLHTMSADALQRTSRTYQSIKQLAGRTCTNILIFIAPKHNELDSIQMYKF